MNNNSLKLLSKFSQNVLYKNIYRPTVVSKHLVKNEFSTSHFPQKKFSTRAESLSIKDITMFDSVKQKIKLQFEKSNLRRTGYYLYEGIADHIDYKMFFKELDMPDTFNSWFLVTELHIWMLMAKLMEDPKYGRFLRNVIVEALWKDVATRAKKLGPEHASVVNSQIKDLSEEFQAALVNYDEGILSDDIVLAGALWRRLLNRNCNPRELEGMVKYVRQMMFLLDKMGHKEFLHEKKIKWIHLKDVLKTIPA